MSMKTAISIPDSLFDAADNLAKRLGISRSELYAKAVDEYLRQHRHDGVTEQLNKVYAEGEPGLDAAWERASLACLRQELEDDEWD